MAELFLDENKGLISEEIWQKKVNKLRTDKPIADKKQAVQKLEKSLVSAVKKRAVKKCGLMFSGGVDSALIALILKKLDADFMCYALGTPQSKDLAYAIKIAEELDFPIRTKTFRPIEIEKTVKKLIKLFGHSDIVTISVGYVVYEATMLALNDKVRNIFTGLGSEEIFGGYQRHGKSHDINKECWQGLLNQFWKRDLSRDSKIADHLKVSYATPFLDEEVIKTAMSIPGEFKRNEEYKKVILREVAEELGLPHEYSFRRKLAAQYGSGFDKALHKIARTHGFKKKTDWLDSLVS
jgi:diphthine-ammonia ligase